jgi:predicted dienelactone hydrolase
VEATMMISKLTRTAALAHLAIAPAIFLVPPAARAETPSVFGNDYVRVTENLAGSGQAVDEAASTVDFDPGQRAMTPASALSVGERVLDAELQRAGLRNADGSPRLPITVWYPAEVREIPAPEPDHPLMEIPSVKRDAPPLGTERRPTILLSHGFGGAAQAMSWFGTAMAASGYLVIAVDHPGNNGREEMTRAGAAMFFERPGDLEAALERVAADPAIGRLVDRDRVAVAGFSAGGFTALALAGGEVEPPRLRRFCEAHPNDGVCRPQLEFAVPIAEVLAILESDASKRRLVEIRRATRPFTVRAALVMAPAIVQSFDPDSLRRIDIPTTFVLGESDMVAPNVTNGFVAARLMPRSRTRLVPDAVHYDFLAACTAAGRSVLPFCRLQKEAAAAQSAAIEEALRLFGDTFGTPR